MNNLHIKNQYEPRNYGEIIDFSIKIFVKKFKDYAILTYLVYGPLTIFMLFSYIMVPILSGDGDPVIVSLFFLLSGLLSAGVSIVFLAATAKFTSEVYHSKPYTYKDAIKYAFKIYPVLAITMMMVAAVIGIPGMFTLLLLMLGKTILGLIPDLLILLILVIVGLTAFYALTLVPYVVIVEKLSGVTALKRSLELFRSSKNASSKVVLIPLFMNTLSSIFSMFTALIPIVGIFLIYLAFPLTVIGMTTVYYDIRIRYEGYDLLMEAENMETEIIVAGDKNNVIYDTQQEGISTIT